MTAGDVLAGFGHDDDSVRLSASRLSFPPARTGASGQGKISASKPQAVNAAASGRSFPA